MLRFTVVLCSIRKKALKIFREEQLHNPNLQGLSMAQKRKVIEMKFDRLGRSEMKALRQRVREQSVKPPPETTKDSGNFQSRRPKITAYEVFYREQASSPSISSIASPLHRERRVFAIFQTLPEKTRKQLEEKAERLSRAFEEKPSSSAKSAANPTQKTKAPTNEMKKPEAKGKTTKLKRRATPYAAFVKHQMPLLKHLPPTDRIKTIAKKWRAMKADRKISKVIVEVGKPKGGTK